MYLEAWQEDIEAPTRLTHDAEWWLREAEPAL